ncbi:hypothetical protein SP41_126 [Salmonella phage 41]|nr:hypothetical protein SP41_126 [Salmonella phage 41]
MSVEDNERSASCYFWTAGESSGTDSGVRNISVARYRER